MKYLHLLRDLHSDTEVQGVLRVGDSELATIEQEWRPTDPGGQPRNSCVPAGRYTLRPHRRPNGDEVVALVNPGHAVYYRPSDRPAGVGRFLILIHKGNWTTDITGCIAPGLGTATSDKGPMVTNSKKAMALIMDYIGGDEASLLIEWQDGEPV